MPILQEANLGQRVQAIVMDVLSEERDRLQRISPDLGVLDEALVPFLTGGKRLRPLFCYWGWRAAGGDPDDQVADDAAMRVAASLEFLQGCALIHDDVMDGSETRRGMPAVHHRFANLHRGQLWLGSPESFGVGAAILIGDLCLAWSDQTLSRAQLPPAAMMATKAVYDEMRTELMAGQYLDLQEQARGGGSVARARTVLQFKSAKYTIERPLHLGAAMAGAGPQLYPAFSAFGLPLGEAFQLRDDVLGVFGDPVATGKPAGDDLREGKRTILVATAFDRADEAQRSVLRQHLGDPALDPAGVAALREIIVDTGALAAAEQLIQQLLNQSLGALADYASSTGVQGHAGINKAVEVLAELARLATQRDG